MHIVASTEPRTSDPDWLGLMAVARARSGFFTASDALAQGISPQLLRVRVHGGWVTHELRGVYRFASAPPTEQDELLALWLWADEEGVYSHQTALVLHGLSDLMPSKIHLTVPESWRYARFARPVHLVLHIAALPAADAQWLGQVRVTTVARTLADCIAAHVSPSHVEQALAQARKRKLLSSPELARLRRALTRSTQ